MADKAKRITIPSSRTAFKGKDNAKKLDDKVEVSSKLNGKDGILYAEFQKVLNQKLKELTEAIVGNSTDRGYKVKIQHIIDSMTKLLEQNGIIGLNDKIQKLIDNQKNKESKSDNNDVSNKILSLLSDYINNTKSSDDVKNNLSAQFESIRKEQEEQKKRDEELSDKLDKNKKSDETLKTLDTLEQQLGMLRSQTEFVNRTLNMNMSNMLNHMKNLSGICSLGFKGIKFVGDKLGKHLKGIMLTCGNILKKVSENIFKIIIKALFSPPGLFFGAFVTCFLYGIFDHYLGWLSFKGKLDFVRVFMYILKHPIKILKGIFRTIGSLGKFAGKIVKRIFNSIRNSKFGKMIGNLIGKITKPIKNAFDVILKPFKGIIKWFKGLGKEGGLVQKVTSFIGKKIHSVVNGIKNLFKPLGTVIGKIFSPIKKVVGIVGGKTIAKGAGKIAAKSLGMAANGVFMAMDAKAAYNKFKSGDVLGGIVKSIVTVLDAIAIIPGIGAPFGALSGLIDLVYEIINQFSDKIKDFFVGIYNQFINWAKGLWDSLTEFFTETVPNFWSEKWHDWIVKPLHDLQVQVNDFFDNSIPTFIDEWVIKPVKDLGKQIVDFFTNSIPTFIDEWVTKPFNDVYDNKIKPIIDSILKNFRDIEDSINKTIDEAIGWVRNIVDSIVGGIKKLVDKIKGYPIVGTLLQKMGFVSDNIIEEQKNEQEETNKARGKTYNSNQVLSAFRIYNPDILNKLQRNIRDLENKEKLSDYEKNLLISYKTQFKKQKDSENVIYSATPVAISLQEAIQKKLSSLKNRTKLNDKELNELINQLKQENEFNNINGNRDDEIKQLKEMIKELSEKTSKVQITQEKTLASANTAAQVGAVAAGASIAGAQSKESVLVETPSSNYNQPGFFYQNYNW